MQSVNIFFFFTVEKMYDQKYGSEDTVQTTNEQKLQQNNNYIHTVLKVTWMYDNINII